MPPLTDDLRTNLVLGTDMDGTGEPANSEHHQQHNLVNAYAIAAEAAHGTTAYKLQTVYDKGATSADSIIQLDDTRDGLILRDAATPITPTKLFAVETEAAGNLFRVSSDGIAATPAVTLTGGLSSAAAGTNSERYGSGALAAGDDGLAVGKDAIASGDQSTAVGISATATAIGASSFGQGADATAASATAIGKNSSASGAGSTALGEDSSVTQADSTALGKGASVTSASAIAIGSGSDCQGLDAICLGTNSQVTQPRAIGIGKNILATFAAAEAESVVIGHAASATGANGVSIGTGSSTTALDATAVGASADTSGATGTAVGKGANVTQAKGTAIGESTTVSAADGTAIGTGATVTHARSTAIGDGAASTAVDQIRLGVGGSDVNVPGTSTLTGAVTAGSTITAAGNILASPGNLGCVNAGTVLNTMENSTNSDADGGRLGEYEFSGRTAAAALHVIGKLSCDHSGAGSDQRGRIALKVNDGADGLTPTTRQEIDWNGHTRILLDSGATLDVEKAATGFAAQFDPVAVTADRAVIIPDRDITLGQDSMALQGGVANLASSQTDVAAIGVSATGPMVPYVGACARITIQPHVAPGVGETCVAELWINGGATGTTTTVSQVSPTRNVPWTNALAAGDRVQVKLTTNGSWATEDVEVVLWIRQDRP